MGQDLGYLASTLQKTGSYASTARISGVNEVTLRRLLPKPEPRRSSVTIPQPSPTTLSIKELIMLLCAEEDLSYHDIMGVSRRYHLSHPRQRFMWVVRKVKPNLSYPEIGRRFGGRDHTTVLHAVREMDKRYAMDEEEREKVDALLVAVRAADGTTESLEAIDYEIGKLEARIEALKAKREEIWK